MKTKIYYWICLFGLIIFAKTALAQNIIIRGAIKDDAPLKALIFEPIAAPTILSTKKEVFPHQGVFEINIPIAQPTEIKVAYKNETFKVFAIPCVNLLYNVLPCSSTTTSFAIFVNSTRIPFTVSSISVLFL